MTSSTGKKTGNKVAAKKAATKPAAGKGAKGGPKQDPVAEFMSRFETVKLKDMVVFSRQFSSMIGSGVAMIRTLTIISEQCENKKLKEVLTDVKGQVEQGMSLSDAFGRHPEV